MKKLYLIFLLVILNFGLFYVRIFSNQLKKIDLKLKDDELAIIILSLDASKSILLHKTNLFSLYTFSYIDDKDLEQNVSLFTDNVDYVFMSEEYPLSYPFKSVLDGVVVLQGIQIEPSRVHFRNKTFCINEIDSCDYIYLTKEIELPENVDAIFYDESLPTSYIESLHQKWLDVYKVTNKSYTILVLNDDYEVVHLTR